MRPDPQQCFTQSEYSAYITEHEDVENELQDDPDFDMEEYLIAEELLEEEEEEWQNELEEIWNESYDE